MSMTIAPTVTNHNPIVTRLVRDLVKHPTAQRERVIEKRVLGIVQNLNLDAIGVLHGVEYLREGIKNTWIIDGMHRLEALKRAGFEDLKVQVELHLTCTTDAEASRLFRDLNNRAAIHSWTGFVQDLQAGRIEATNIVKIAQLYDLEVKKYAGPRNLTCVGALRTIYNLDEGETLKKTLHTATQAWGHRTPAAIEGKLLEGIARVLRTNPDIKMPILIEKLSKFPGGPSALLGLAKLQSGYTYNKLPIKVEIVIVDTYNKTRVQTARIKHSHDK
jgi:hypothetical protein